MIGINKVYLVGHLGTAPQAGLTKNGKGYTRLSLATNRSRRKEDGNWENITDWHNVTVWGKQGEACSQHLSKGSKVMIEGYINHYEVTDSEGAKQKHTGVTAHSIEFFNAQQSTIAA